MDTPKTEVHLCNGCQDPIPQNGPRYHCMSCVNYNLCATCQGSARLSGGHRDDHIYQHIQDGVSAPSGFPLVGGGTALQYTGSQHPFWDRLIKENKTASDRFGRLINSIHYSISRNCEPQSSNLEPEKASYIMTLLGFPDQDNIFNLFLTRSTRHPQGLAWSDFQTLRIYKTCGWEYQKSTRDHSEQTKSVPPEYREIFKPVDDSMPLLTRTGLRAMVVMETLANPQGFPERFNALLYTINESQGALKDLDDNSPFPVGPIPENCWPLSADAVAVSRRAVMQKTAREAIVAADDLISRYQTISLPISPVWGQ
ncbi:hypothetical protein HOY80DRAFT_1076088 [Tuber brumale]|nr:hypothetical protein HOY80DRAFT_1076088 [Tuber brumale]